MRRLFSTPIPLRFPFIPFLILLTVLMLFTATALMIRGIPLGWVIAGGAPYPTAVIAGEKIGGATRGEIEAVLYALEEDLADDKITFAKDGKSAAFGLTDLGIAFDKEATEEKVKAAINIGFRDRALLALNQSTFTLPLEPAFAIDSGKCEQAVKALTFAEKKTKSAAISYKDGVVITPEVNGETLDPRLTCEEAFAQVNNGRFTSVVVTKITKPQITAAHYEKILPKIEKITSGTLTLTYKERYWKVKPKELFSYLRFKFDKKTDSIKVVWSEPWLNAYANAVARVTDSVNAAPSLGTCEYLVSRGGYALDKTATKNIFKNLHKKGERRYELKVNYIRPYIKKMTPVNPGSKGAVYLTFDDGMSYGTTIMHTAVCYGVKVAFFIIGSRAGLDDGGMVAAVAAGHAVQSHGWEHAHYDYGDHSYSWQYNDIKSSIDVITGITGVRPTYFRPPGGNCSAITHTAAAANNINLILWGATAADTSTSSSAQICQNILNSTQAGDSILAHSTKSATAAALPCIIEGLAKRGFTMKALR